jgi:probable F420-dependent oxidoreductase
MHIGVTAFLTDLTMAPDAFAVAAEERGYHSLYVPEHTHLPVRDAQPPTVVEGVHLEDYRRSLDPFAALAAAAAVTDRILLGTGVALVAQHDPIVLAKQIATIDHMAGGRFVLGMGFGWNRQEAADHGVEFSERRAIAREKVLCMQALWRDDEATFVGRWVALPPSYSWPKPCQRPRVRTLIGGGAGPKLFAAVAEYADGWMPIGGAGLSEALPELRRVFEAAGRNPESLHVVPFGTVPSAGKLAHYASLGVTEVVVRDPSGPPDDMRRVLDDYTVYLNAT